MWSMRTIKVAEEMPPFNHILLKEYHRRRIADIPRVLENLFKQAVCVINSRCPDGTNPFTYIGYEELSPEERVRLLRSGITFENKYAIRKTRKRVLRFQFEYLAERHNMLVDVPYLHHHHILLNDTKYYPLFAITDRGGLSRRDDVLILQVMRTKLRFIREKQSKVMTMENVVIIERPITAKIHQGTKGRNKNTPLIFFSLAKYGFGKTMQQFGVYGHIRLVDKMDNCGDFYHIALPNDLFIRFNRSVCDSTKDELFNTNIKRMLLGLYSIYSYCTEFTLDDLFDSGYYIMALGTWTNTSVKSSKYLYKNAKEFLAMNETLLDPVWQRQHATIGVTYNNLDELLVFMYNNIDRLLVEHKLHGKDLLHKKLAGADVIMSGMVAGFNRKMFRILNNRRQDHSINVKGMMHYQPFNKTVTQSSLFEPAPTMYSDNMLAVLGKRFLAFTDIENSAGRTGAGKKISTDMLKAHYSFPAVCSIFTYPSSNPIIAGSINPHVQVDLVTGNIQEPYFIEKLSQIYGQSRKEPT